MNLLDLLFPRRCLGCGRVGSYFCGNDRQTIRIIEARETICPVCEKPSFGGTTHARCKTKYTIDGLTSFFRYRGVVQKAIKALKYRFVSDLAEEFVSLIEPSSFLTMKQWNNVTMVPIPLHPSRLRFRGFNQAELLGRLIAQRLRMQVRNDLLVRTRSTTPQVEMKDRNKRLKNMACVFSCNNVAIKQWSQVFLFDDVFTSGATMRAAANVLKREGAEFVWGITMAR